MEKSLLQTGASILKCGGNFISKRGIIKQKKPLVSGNAGDKKNLHLGGRKINFLLTFYGQESF